MVEPEGLESGQFGKSLQTVHTHRQGEKLRVKIFRAALHFLCKIRIRQKYFVIFDQACSRMFPLYDSTYFVSYFYRIQLKGIREPDSNCNPKVT